MQLHLTFQSDFSSVAMTRSGLSLEELRIVEGQGQNSEVITPPEEINRINELGKQAICSNFGGFKGNLGHVQSVIKRGLEYPSRMRYGEVVKNSLLMVNIGILYLKIYAEKLFPSTWSLFYNQKIISAQRIRMCDGTKWLPEEYFKKQKSDLMWSISL